MMEHNYANSAITYNSIAMVGFVVGKTKMYSLKENEKETPCFGIEIGLGEWGKGPSDAATSFKA